MSERAFNNPEMTPDIVKAYLIEIGKTPLLNTEEEVELAQIIEVGLYAHQVLSSQEKTETDISAEELIELVERGEQAKRDFIQANLRLVVSIAKNQSGKGVEFMDLISEGNLGLVRAVEKFDYTKGFKFSTYATHWINLNVTRAVTRHASAIPLSQEKAVMYNQMRAITRRLGEELGRPPSDAEIAVEMDETITPQNVAQLRNDRKEIVSLHAPTASEDGKEELWQRIDAGREPSPLLEASATRGAVRKALSRLDDPIDVEILELLFGFAGKEPMLSSRTIGRTIGMPYREVEKRKEAALEALLQDESLAEL